MVNLLNYMIRIDSISVVRIKMKEVLMCSTLLLVAEMIIPKEMIIPNEMIICKEFRGL